MTSDLRADIATMAWLKDLEDQVKGQPAPLPAYGGYGGGSGYGLGLGIGIDGLTPAVADVPLHLNIVVASCIGWLSRNFATADMRMVKQSAGDGGGGEAIEGHAFLELMDRPNPIDDFHSFWHSFILSDGTDGNTFFIKIRNNARGIHSLWWVPPWDVRIVGNPDPNTNAERPILYFEVSVGGRVIRYPPEDVIHVKDGKDPTNVLRGLAPLKAGLRSVSTIDRAELYTQTLMRNCGAISGMLSPSNKDETLEKDNVASIRAQFAQNQGGFNSGKPFLSTQGLRFDKIALSPEEMALDTIRDFPISAICALIGTPAMVVGLPDPGKTYSNLDLALRIAWQNGLIPRQSRAAEAFDRQCPELIGPNQRLKWDYTNVKALQDDWSTKMDALVKATGKPVMSVNEGRKLLHLPPIAGKDDLAEPPPPPALAPPGADPNGTPPKPGLPKPKPRAALPPPPKGKAGLDAEDDFDLKMSPPRIDDLPPGDEEDPHEDNTFGLPDGKPLRRALKRFYAKQYAHVLGTIPTVGAPIPLAFAPLTDYNDPMAAAMTPLISAYWDWGGRTTLGKLGLDPDEWRVVDPNLHAKIAESTLAFCDSTNATTTKRLNEALAELREQLHQGLVVEGETIPQLRKRVQSVFGEMSREKADQIARTEASRAVHAASLMSAEESGVVEGKRWLLSSGACPFCHELAAKSEGGIALSASFGKAGTNETYSDIRMPPGHPHCRCSCTYVLTKEYRDIIEAETGKPAPEDIAPLDPSTKPIRRKPQAVGV